MGIIAIHIDVECESYGSGHNKSIFEDMHRLTIGLTLLVISWVNMNFLSST
jgi:hypothetical protein